jgi:hypothetical protein
MRIHMAGLERAAAHRVQALAPLGKVFAAGNKAAFAAARSASAVAAEKLASAAVAAAGIPAVERWDLPVATEPVVAAMVAYPATASVV